MASRLLVAIECRRCSDAFVLCRSCYRGDVYCCEKCRVEAREEQKRQARADYLRRLGEEAVRDEDRQRKQRWRQQQREQLAGVTDQTPKDQGQTVRKQQVDSGSQAATATTEQDSGRVLDEASEEASPASIGLRAPGPAAVPTKQDGAELAALLGQLFATGGSAVLLVAPAEQDGAELAEFQQGAPPEAVPARCSRCGAQGWLAPWVLRADAQQRSLRRLLATGGP